MHVLLTGASGFVGSHLVAELVTAGHTVTGLTRSNAGARVIADAGGEPLRGVINDLEALVAAAVHADGVVHAAFDHDPTRQKAASEADACVIATLGHALAGSNRPLVITSGTGLVRSRTGAPANEFDEHLSSVDFPRAATEEAADRLIEGGGRVTLVRLSQVHDTRRQGRISWQIDLARKTGRVAYIGDGYNRVPAVHVSDAVRLFRLSLERGETGARLHAVAEEGVAMRGIAEAIGERLALPVVSLSPEEVDGYFGWLAPLASADLPASGAWTRATFGWQPIGPSLLSDLRSLVDSADAGCDRHEVIAGAGSLRQQLE